MNNAINEIKSTLEGTNSRITEAEDRISKVEDRMVEINETEEKRKTSTCAGDLRELNMVPLRSQGFCGYIFEV